MMTDPIADMLTRIRNGNQVKQDSVDVPDSRLKREIARILKEEGFIRDFRQVKDAAGRQVLRIYLKYSSENERVISGIRRISKPGRRVYARRDQIPRVLGGLGVAVLSTSRGVMSDRQARQERVGGEVLCYVW